MVIYWWFNQPKWWFTGDLTNQTGDLLVEVPSLKNHMPTKIVRFFYAANPNLQPWWFRRHLRIPDPRNLRRTRLSSPLSLARSCEVRENLEFRIMING